MLVLQHENCSETRWGDPVVVQLRPGSPEEIDGPLKALNCLVHRWPPLGGEEYGRAKEMCMAALGGRIPCQSARVAFLAAAEEAETLVSGNQNRSKMKDASLSR